MKTTLCTIGRAKFTYVCTRARKKHDNPSADNIASESVDTGETRVYPLIVNITH